MMNDNGQGQWANPLPAQTLAAQLQLVQSLLPDFHRLQAELAQAEQENARLKARLQAQMEAQVEAGAKAVARIATLVEAVNHLTQRFKDLEAKYEALRAQKEDELW